MVTKRIRSEYMKKFKDPKWETYSKCYEEMLKYRLTRRLLEHTHNPWFWSGSDSDSDSGGRSPAAPSKNQVQCATRGRTEAEQKECEGAKTQPRDVPRLPLLGEENVSGEQGCHLHGETNTAEEERDEQRAINGGSKQITVAHTEQNPETDPGGPGPQQSKLSKLTKQTRCHQRVKPVVPQLPREENKEGRHPFALYGSGEKDADIASRKTHNVGPVASTNEIHESALRARTRRAVERQIQTQRNERRRAKSADVSKARKLVQPEFNPWLTEYMRCFSARSR
ncbi:centriole, cilia and spindle-associated protein [Aulostomus maculatus]